MFSQSWKADWLVFCLFSAFWGLRENGWGITVTLPVLKSAVSGDKFCSDSLHAWLRFERIIWLKGPFSTPSSRDGCTGLSWTWILSRPDAFSRHPDANYRQHASPVDQTDWINHSLSFNLFVKRPVLAVCPFWLSLHLAEFITVGNIPDIRPPPPPPVPGTVSSQLAWVTLSKCNGYLVISGTWLSRDPNLSVPPDDCRSYFGCSDDYVRRREITQVFPQHLKSVDAKSFCLSVLSQHPYVIFIL